MYYGFDIGGTKIALGVFDKNLKLQWETRVPTPRESYDEFLTAIAALVAQADSRFGVKGSVGIGIPECPKLTMVRCMRPTFLLPAVNRCAPISPLCLNATCV